MPRINRCQCSHFMFDGFCVQRGMLYGSTYGQKFVTNGSLTVQNCYNVYWQSINADYEEVWTKSKLSFMENPTLFSAIYKEVNRRNDIGLSLQYQSSAELEQVRWARDEQHRHFQDHDPLATPRLPACPNQTASVKYNSSKERNTLTQRPNTVKYVYTNKVVVI